MMDVEVEISVQCCSRSVWSFPLVPGLGKRR